MTAESIEKVLGDYIVALTGTCDELNESSTLESLGVDSISLVKIFVFIEKTFDVSLVDSGVNRERIETFGKLTEFIRSLKEGENLEP